MLYRINRSMIIRLSSTVLFILALILLNLNITAWLNLLNDNFYKVESVDPVSCASSYNSISEDVEAIPIGVSETESYSMNKFVFKYSIDNVGNVSVRIDIYHPKDKRYIGKVVLLIHDFEGDPSSLTWLTLKLVNKGFIVVVPDNRVNILGANLRVISKNPYESWIHITMLNVKKTISYLTKVVVNNETTLSTVGIGFGGLVSVLIGIYDARVYSSVSIGNVFSIRNSAERGGFAAFYVKDLDDIHPCYEPLNVISYRSSRILVVMGMFDEVSTYRGYMSEIISVPNVEISVIPNKGRYYEVPSQWLNFVIEYLVEEINTRSDAKVFFEAGLLKTSIHVDAPRGEYAVLYRPAISGFSWRVKTIDNNRISLIDTLYPSEYVVVDTTSFRVIGMFKKASTLGLVVSIIYIPIWVIINKPLLKKNLPRNAVGYAVFGLNIALMFYYLMPCFLAINFYHISIIQLSEILHSYVLFIPFTTIFIIISQPTIFTATLIYNNKLKTIYLSLPLLMISIHYSILLYLTTIFDTNTIILPTIPLIVVIAEILLYILKPIQA